MILVISYNLSVNKKCINGDKKDLNNDIKAPLQINLKVLPQTMICKRSLQ